MGMFGGRLEGHQVHNIDHANAEVGLLGAQDAYGGQGFERGYVAAAGHDDVGVSIIVRGPFPDAEAGGAVGYGFVDGEPLGSWLLPCDDEIDVVLAAQAMVGNG